MDNNSVTNQTVHSVLKNWLGNSKVAYTAFQWMLCYELCMLTEFFGYTKPLLQKS